MKKGQIAICDRDPDYTFRFTEYANGQADTLFLVHGFTDVEELLVYLQEFSVDILLISELYVGKIPKNGPWKQVILLVEGNFREDGSAYPGIMKFQSGAVILRQLMHLYAEEVQGKPGVACRTEQMKRIGVYSPVGRVGKTGFALELGQALRKQKKTLYLNLEEYSGFETLYPYGDGGTLSELLYFMKQGKNAFACKLESVVQQMNGLDYIPPLKSPVELRHIRWEDWERLLEALEKESRYEVVILDLSGVVDGLYEILERCDGIYMLVAPDETAQAKLSQYVSVLQMQQMEELLERTIQFPHMKERELKDFIREEEARWLDS